LKVTKALTIGIAAVAFAAPAAAATALLMVFGAFIAFVFGLGVAQALPPGPPPACNPGWHYDPVVIHCQPDADNPAWQPQQGPVLWCYWCHGPYN
jgi:hypothetical protein